MERGRKEWENSQVLPPRVGVSPLAAALGLQTPGSRALELWDLHKLPSTISWSLRPRTGPVPLASLVLSLHNLLVQFLWRTPARTGLGSSLRPGTLVILAELKLLKTASRKEPVRPGTGAGKQGYTSCSC